jgi:cytochrome c556
MRILTRPVRDFSGAYRLGSILLFLASLVIAMAWCSANGSAQKLATPEEFQRQMKIIGSAFDATVRAINMNSPTDAKVQVSLARQAIAISSTYWVMKKNSDAARMAREAIAKLDTLDKTLSSGVVNIAAVSTALQSAKDTCNTCHNIYREGDQTNGYRIKPGSF